MAHLNAQIAAQTAKVEELLATVRKILAIAGSDGIDMEEISQRIVKATDEAVRLALQRLEGLDVSSLLYRVDHADRILADILLLLDAKGMAPQADGIVVENLDNPTHIDQTRIDVTSVVPGSSEIDVASEPEVGKEYILSDGVDSQEMVRVISIMRGGSTIRAKLEAPVKEAYRNGKGVLTRSTALISGGRAYIGGGEKNSVLTPNIVDWQGEVISGGATSASAAFNTATKESYDISGAAMFMTGGVSLAQFVGLAMMHPEQGVDGWRYIDYEGNLIPELNALLGEGKNQERFAWFDQWPLTSPENIVTETIDGQEMTRFNKGCAKSWTGKSGSAAAGKFCIGAGLGDTGQECPCHPAFYDYYTGRSIDHFYLGKYEGFDDGGMVGSQSGRNVLVNISPNDFRAKCESRNSAGISGFHAMNFYEHIWHSLLCFIKGGNGDLQKVFGSGIRGSAKPTGTNEDGALTVLGLNSPWGNVWEFADGLEAGADSKLKIWVPGAAKVFGSMGFCLQNSNTINTIKTGTSPTLGNRDMGILMLGKYSSATAIVKGYQWGGVPRSICWVSGDYGRVISGDAGPFCMDLYNRPTDAHYDTLGGRLAKY